MTEIISKATLRAFQEHLVSKCTARDIETLFTNRGIVPLEYYDSKDSSLVKRSLIKQCYASLDLQVWNDVSQLLEVFEDVVLDLNNLLITNRYSNQQISERWTESRRLIKYLERDGFKFEKHKFVYIENSKSDTQNVEKHDLELDLFEYQFPAGLPFGVPKPNFSVVAEKGRQKLRYELQEELHLIKGKVYPDFTFQDLEALFNLNSETNGVFKKAMKAMNRGYEEKFFIEYANKFNMAGANVPVLIPQAWIQWHSQSRSNLRSNSSLHKDELYRVDFVAFWNNKRYVILVDGIEHYAVKRGVKWEADEESYAKRLKEDRKLRKEGWHVFRVSNWELRNDDNLGSILQDLQEFIGFE